MKKTVIVNINGIIFHIDEDAYAKLSAYLDALHRYFGQQSEGKEIVSDIESRIAELLQPLINDAKQSVTIDDIEGIIETLGKPEDIAGEETQENEPTAKEQEPATSRTHGRRLYRDNDNSVIGGVCSGISAYFDIDPVIMRIIFLALIFAGGVSLIIYPILWIVIPAARTASQKLEMRGENVTVNNIERAYHSSGQTDENHLGGRIRSFLNDVFAIFGKVFYACWRIMAFLVGIFLIGISVIVMISLIAAIFFNKFYMDELTMNSGISVKDFLNFIVTPAESTWLLIIFFIIIFIPLTGLIYAGLKMVIRFKAKDKWAVLSASLLWIAAIIVGFMLIISHVNNYRAEGSTKEMVTIPAPKNNTLNVCTLYKDNNDPFSKPYYPPQGMFLIRTRSDKSEILGVTRVDIEKSDKSYAEMEIVREARGASLEEATAASKQIKTVYSLSDSVISIQPTFALNQGKWKFNSAKIKLHIPVGMRIYLVPNIARLLDNVNNSDNYYNEEMVGKTWVMTENGLELLKVTKTDSFDLKNPTSHIIYIKKKDNIQLSKHQLRFHDFGSTTLNGKHFIFRPINLDIKKSENNSINLQIEKDSPWENGITQQSINQTITYTFEQKDSVLWLDPVFLLPNNEKKNNQKVNVVLYIPINYVIHISEDMEPMIEKFARKLDISDYDFVRKTWKMTIDGFREIEEKKEPND